MLPKVTTRDVSRDDVDRVAWWLEDRELSDRWFGHYRCGDPVHRGYEPQRMLEATELEWGRVFDDSRRLFLSIYSDNDEHIGECQMMLDGEDGAELSLLIGLREFWHLGYGTSAVTSMLDKAFRDLGLLRAWVNVPEDNSAALGLFEKLGFVREETRALCTGTGGAALSSYILAIDAASYLGRQGRELRQQHSMPAVTIWGLPGSGSELVAAKVARSLERRFVDQQIAEGLCRRLGCTSGELAAFEASHLSFWTRFLNTIAVPMEWTATYDAGYHWFTPPPTPDYGTPREDLLTQKRYLDAASGVLKRLLAEKDVVLHDGGRHLPIPAGVEAIKVFVSASPAFRRQRLIATRGLSAEDATRDLEQRERDMRSISKKLSGSKPLDMTQYDITLNLDRMTFDSAAQIVVGVLRAPFAETQRGASQRTAIPIPVE
jgi:RimJ/RimL family protein N-acetyltransferase/cytidylate kinase